MMYYHSWERSVRRGKDGVRIVSRAFEPEYVVVQGTEDHDRRQGVDLILIRRIDAEEVFRVDVKIDDKSQRTGNLPLEDGHAYESGKWGSGWCWTTKSHFVVFYNEERNRAWSLSIPEIRAAWPSIQAQPRRPTGTQRGSERWQTFNYCCRIDWLKERGLILREFTVEGDQMTLYSRPTQLLLGDYVSR